MIKKKNLKFEKKKKKNVKKKEKNVQILTKLSMFIYKSI